MRRKERFPRLVGRVSSGLHAVHVWLIINEWESEHRRRLDCPFRGGNGSVLVALGAGGWGERCAGGFRARCHSQPTLVSRGLFSPSQLAAIQRRVYIPLVAVRPRRKHRDSRNGSTFRNDSESNIPFAGDLSSHGALRSGRSNFDQFALPIS